jgi:hypothetical protein
MENKSWLLKLVLNVPGRPPYIVYETSEFDLTVTAETEDDARKMAYEYEGRKLHTFEQGDLDIKGFWLSKEHSLCIRAG